MLHTHSSKHIYTHASVWQKDKASTNKFKHDSACRSEDIMFSKVQEQELQLFLSYKICLH